MCLLRPSEKPHDAPYSSGARARFSIRKCRSPLASHPRGPLALGSDGTRSGRFARGPPGATAAALAGFLPPQDASPGPQPRVAKRITVKQSRNCTSCHTRHPQGAGGRCAGWCRSRTFLSAHKGLPGGLISEAARWPRLVLGGRRGQKRRTASL